jgi:hypothetical protein
MALSGRRLSFSEQDINNVLQRLPCEKNGCQGAMEQAAAPKNEGVCWSTKMKCCVCRCIQFHTNDPTERIHLESSVQKQQQLRQRRTKKRLKDGDDAKDGVKEEINNNGRGVKALNLQTVAAALLNGSGYEEYAAQAILSSQATISESSWNRYAHAVWQAAVDLTRHHLTLYIRNLCNKISDTTGCSIGVAADGAWNKRREAPKHCLIIFHGLLPIYITTVEKAVHGEGKHGEATVIRSGNYDGSSKGMEPAAWAKVAKELDAIDDRFRMLVSTVCVDRDASVTDTICTTFPNATINNDPGHFTTNVRNSIMKVVGQSKEYYGFAARAAQWVMTCIKRAEDPMDTCGLPSSLPPCKHVECHPRQCWLQMTTSTAEFEAPLSTSLSSSSSSSSSLSSLSLSFLASVRPKRSLLDVLKFNELNTVLAAIPKTESVARVLDMPTPSSQRISIMFSKFLSLMDHFFLHYSTLPCSSLCPCYSPKHIQPIINEEPADDEQKDEPNHNQAEGKEEKQPEGKEEKKNTSSQDTISISRPHIKFRFNPSIPKHLALLRALVPIFLDIMQHMGAILHGLNTCAAEQFARERSPFIYRKKK